MDFVITSNGPGEISTWVKPVIEELKRKYPPHQITVFLLPCQYASGYEAEMVRSQGVERVLVPRQFWKFVFKGDLPEKINFSSQGAILFLGGDQFYPLLLSWRLKYPVFGYTEEAVRWPQFYRRYFLRDDYGYKKNLQRNIPTSKMMVVGDLMIDSLYQELESLGIQTSEDVHRHYQKLYQQQKNLEQYRVSILPGSRDWQAKYMIPLFLRTADGMSAIHPGIQFQMIVSPTFDFEAFKEWVQDPALAHTVDGVSGTIIQEKDEYYLSSGQGPRIRLIRGKRVAHLIQSTLALTIPGTNTAELAILGIPFISVFPLNQPEVIPLEGIAGMVEKIPIFGMTLKKRLVPYLASKRRYFAWPNIKSQTTIVKELVGTVSWKEIRDEALNLLSKEEELFKTSKQLVTIMGAPGASQKLVELLMKEAVP